MKLSTLPVDIGSKDSINVAGNFDFITLDIWLKPGSWHVCPSSFIHEAKTVSQGTPNRAQYCSTSTKIIHVGRQRTTTPLRRSSVELSNQRIDRISGTYCSHLVASSPNYDRSIVMVYGWSMQRGGEGSLFNLRCELRRNPRMHFSARCHDLEQCWTFILQNTVTIDSSYSTT